MLFVILLIATKVFCLCSVVDWYKVVFCSLVDIFRGVVCSVVDRYKVFLFCSLVDIFRVCLFVLLSTDTRVFLTVAVDLVIFGIQEPVRFALEVRAKVFPVSERFWQFTKKPHYERFHVRLKQVQNTFQYHANNCHGFTSYFFS